MATFLEGVESITMLCSLVVLLPAIGLALVASRRHAWVVGGAVVGTATMMWARAGGRWRLDAHGDLRWLVGLVILATFATAFRHVGDHAVIATALGLASGAVAGWLWRPCVGERFADVLDRAGTDHLTSLIGMHAYVLGVLLPAVLLAALPTALPRVRPLLQHGAVRGAALSVAAVYGVAVAAGWYDDFVSELFRISAR